MNVYTLDAFTDVPGGGNPAGVVLDCENLSAKKMQEIAGKVGFSETAFVLPSTAADYNVRFFTPTEEVDLCGHATIATFKLLFLQGFLQKNRLLQETGAGILEIRISTEGLIWMEQASPTFLDILPKETIATSLGLTVSDIRADLPIQVVSTGLADIFVPVNSLATLRDFQPRLSEITDLSKRHQATGYHVFTTETLYGNSCACRNLAPLYGIDEEAATGTSSGALACYLYHHGLVSKEVARNLRFEQGHFMKRPSLIHASLEINDDRIDKVQVGGDAVLTGQIKF